MSTFFFFNLAAICLALPMTAMSQQVGNAPASALCAIAASDASSITWEKTTYEKSSSGAMVPRRHRVLQVQTGLNYRDGQQWSRSDPTFQIGANGQFFFADK